MTPKAWFLAAPIKRKLMLIGLLTSGLALVSVSLILTVKDVVEWRSLTIAKLTNYASELGDNVVASIVFDDRKAASETLSTFAAKRGIAHIAIYDKNDREFAVYLAPGHPAHEMPNIGDGEYVFTSHSLVVSAPIRHLDETLGTIRLGSNLQGLYSELWSNTILIFMVAFGVFLLTIYFFAKLQRVIVAPILDLAEVMQKVSAEQNYGVCAVVFQQDEIGTLARTFNEMLERIQLRDAELAQHRERLEEEVSQRTADLRAANEKLEKDLVERRQLSEAFKQSQEAIVMADAALNIIYVNPGFTRLFGYVADEVVGRPVDLISPPESQEPLRPAQTTVIARCKGAYHGEVLRLAKDGRVIPVLLNVTPIFDEQGAVETYVGTMVDLSKLKQAEAQVLQRMAEISCANAELKELNGKLEQAQNHLLQSDKMASIGILAAGVAHEINNPIGYVSSNLETLKNYVADFLHLLEAYETAQHLIPENSAMFAEVDKLKRMIDLDFLKQDVVGLLAESRHGTERVRKIVRDLKDFSHVDAQEKWMEEDIHQGLESTLNVIWNELKYNCEVKKVYGELPLVECMISQLNQVFMNLLVNAAQAIEDHGTITIRTAREGEQVWIEISDTGSGIPAENLKRIFDPFFTTKPVGKGTGLGLSVSYSIVQKHHGSIEVESEPGKGTLFRIWLPLKQPAAIEESGHG